MPQATRKTTTSRKPAAPRTRATAAAVPEREEVYPDAAEAQEIEADGRYVTALLTVDDGGEDRTEELRIIPPGAWRQSWQRLMQQGQMDAFVQIVVHPDDVELYMDLDPTNTELGAFIDDAGQQAGESVGKSRGPARSSRNTRRR